MNARKNVIFVEKQRLVPDTNVGNKKWQDMTRGEKMTEYEKDLNELKEQILKEGDTLVSKRDLLERFCKIDKEYNGEPWNLLQILSNINVLIGEEPCEELDFVQPHKKVSVNLEPCAGGERRE